MDNKSMLGNPYDLVNEIANEEEKQYYELDDILVYIAVALIKYRIKNNLTQRGLAQILGFSQATVARLENVAYEPSIRQLLKILSVLGLKLRIVPKELQSNQQNDLTTNYKKSENTERIE